MPQRTSEAVHPGRDESAGWDDATLILLVGNDFSKLVLDVLGLGGLTTKSAESGACFLKLSTLDKVTWRVWEEQQATTEDCGPCKLNTDGNAVSTAVLAVLSCVDDAGSKEDTDSNAELVASDESTTNLLGALQFVSASFVRMERIMHTISDM